MDQFSGVTSLRANGDWDRYWRTQAIHLNN
jgi:hypothetical protein